MSSASIGIAIFPDDGNSYISLTKNADLAMYKAKDSGRNNYQFYTNNFSILLEKRAKIIFALKVAIKNGNEFFLNYQPKVSIKTGKTIGLETLVRWNSSVLGFVRPDEFIKIAEETHLILEIDHFILKQAVRDYLLLKDEGFKLEHLSINLSGVQLEFGHIVETIQNLLTETKINPEELELEITESYLASNMKDGIETLKMLRNLGIELAIDDFGTGYSSMSYLQKLPVTRLKVDKSFVDSLPYSADSIAVIKAILSLAEAFNLKVTVEGVEYLEQLNFFKDKYCHDIQGYVYSKPLKLEDLRQFLISEQSK